ncbi:MAG TPA: MFS transporter, partial [Hyphomicrobiaceae bacterium]|nr:MFS transporter [Hyphomicrobiaceae bacterium]
MTAASEVSPFSVPAFRTFWAARVIATIAYQALSIAIGWKLYELTGNVLDLGLVGLVQFVPMVALTLVVGHVADRYDRSRIVAICQAIEALAALSLAAAVAYGVADRTWIFATAAALGAARAFENPTMQALLPQLVDRAIFPRATAWSASANQTAQIVGPAVGGLLFLVHPIAPFVAAGSASSRRQSRSCAFHGGRPSDHRRLERRSADGALYRELHVRGRRGPGVERRRASGARR